MSPWTAYFLGVATPIIIALGFAIWAILTNAFWQR